MNIRIKRMQPLLLANLRNILRHHLIRMVVEQHINRAQLLHRLLHHLLAIPLLFQIRRVQETFLPVLLHQRLRFLGVFLLFGELRDEGVCAFHGEEHGG